MKVLIPLPSRDFDPTEAAVSWQRLDEAGIDVVFATPDGAAGRADPRMLSGVGLDLWGFVPLLRRLPLLGLALRADRRARTAYRMLQAEPAFQSPLRYAELRVEDYDGLLLPGGHAPGMRPYLEDRGLQALVAAFFDADKPVAAICHGVLVAARAISPRSGHSVLHGRRTTALTWALERSAWQLMRYVGRFWDAGYYRTYADGAGQAAGYMSVHAEVTRALARPEDFMDVPSDSPHRFRQTSGLFRDTPDDARPAFVVVDGRYVSARWPGDVNRFAQRFIEVLRASPDRAA